MVRAKARDLSLLEGALLALLRQAPSSGYDLRKLFAETPFVHFSDSPGAVYPALRRLERLGHLASVGVGGGRRRRPLRSTAGGLQALRRWLRRPVTRNDLVQARDVTMLRFAFTEEVLGRKACAMFLVQYQAEVAAYLRELQKYRHEHLSKFTLSGRLAFNSGIEGFKARQRWARRAVRAITEADR